MPQSGELRFSLSNLIEYLRDFESTCKTVLAHESGDPGVHFNEKTEGRKFRDTVPLIFCVIGSKNRPPYFCNAFCYIIRIRAEILM
jgi:hypothetical protein